MVDMAIVVKINKKEEKASIDEKIQSLGNTSGPAKKFPASKFTGKIKSFGDGMAFQKKLRNEWR
jgi:hypothetical protein